MNLNDYAQACHTANAKWWQDANTGEPIKRNKGELLALVHSEISECLEGERKSKEEPCAHCANLQTEYRGLDLNDGPIWFCKKCSREHTGPLLSELCLMDDKLPHRRMAEVELADTLIRIFDYAGEFGYDLQGAFEEKMEYNKNREDHKHEARRISKGEQF